MNTEYKAVTDIASCPNPGIGDSAKGEAAFEAAKAAFEAAKAMSETANAAFEAAKAAYQTAKAAYETAEAEVVTTKAVVETAQAAVETAGRKFMRAYENKDFALLKTVYQTVSLSWTAYETAFAAYETAFASASAASQQYRISFDLYDEVVKFMRAALQKFESSIY